MSGTRSALLAAVAALLTPDGAGNILAAQTPAQFDSSLKLATTAFLQRALGNFQNVYAYSAATTLTASQVGSFFNVVGTAPYTITLPLTTTCPQGAVLSFQNTSSGVITFAAQTSDEITVNGATLTSITFGVGDNITFVKAANGYWFAQGAAALGGTAQFVNSISALGYQKLPSGLIIQWGSSTYSGASDSTALYNYPIAFPTAPLSIAGQIGAALGNATLGFQNSSASQFNVGYHSSSGAAAGGLSFNYIAVGH